MRTESLLRLARGGLVAAAPHQHLSLWRSCSFQKLDLSTCLRPPCLTTPSHENRERLRLGYVIGPSCRQNGKKYLVLGKRSRAKEKFVKNTAMTAKNTLSQIVRLHREIAQLARLELSMLAGVGKTVVFDIEHGKRPFDSTLSATPSPEI